LEVRAAVTVSRAKAKEVAAKMSPDESIHKIALRMNISFRIVLDQIYSPSCSAGGAIFSMDGDAFGRVRQR
jgi:hypothetical protein